MIHWMVLKCSFESDAFIVSSLVDMYSKFGEVENERIAAELRTGELIREW
ncbi:hypothetical protein Bca101_047820 [Brassica carinata]